MTGFASRPACLIGLALLAACTTAAPVSNEDAPLRLEPANFSDLPGWKNDDLAVARPALMRSCSRVQSMSSERPVGLIAEAGSLSDWRAFCTEFFTAAAADDAALRRLIQARLTPYAVYAGDKAQGLFTGYYESALRGSRTKHGAYRYPLYRRPDDLVMVDLGQFRDTLKGQRIAGRVMGGNLEPYEDRAAIVAGHWPHNDKVLVWVDDAVDAFFVQVQGSGLVQMDDGTILRIGYAGQNGHPYYAIGRELIKRGHLTKNNVSMQAIRTWLAGNADEADDVMNTNKSYVFFRTLDSEGPVGGESVALTPERSLAIDHSKIPYGMPVWVDIDYPVDGRDSIQRLVMAQDTGGAIRGAVRGDLFWGYGARAEAMAGPMKAQGRYWLLLPKTTAPSAHMP